MAPSYKLTYFDNTGKAEAIRLIFVYAGIPFEDDRILRTEWDKYKSSKPLGQVPVLEINGKILTQSVPISRYLASSTDLAGKTAEENYEIDAAVEILYDLLRGAYESSHLEPNEEVRKIKLERFENMYKAALPLFEEKAKKNGGYIALNRLTWADFVYITAYETIKSFQKFHNDKDLFANYPNLLNVVKNVVKVKNIRDWIKKRPRITRPWFVYDLRDDNTLF